jgi:hypothetical protein
MLAIETFIFLLIYFEVHNALYSFFFYLFVYFENLWSTRNE